MLTSTTAYVEWTIATRWARPESLPGRVVALAVAEPVAAIVVALVAAPLIFVYLGRRQLDPLPVLAGRARRIAAGERVQIPYQERGDEIGDLAMALREWQGSAALREVLLSSAPVGICRVDLAGTVRDTNRAAQAMLGYRKEEIEGLGLLDLVHPEDRHLAARASPEALAAAGTDRAVVEARLRCSDGTWRWCSAVAAPVSHEEGAPDSFVVILEDIDERRRQAGWAAQVQREMLPETAPELPGYELAGACLAAQDVAGDFYDWVEPAEGFLDLTVADVMGKGMGPALVMAALRTALRTAPVEMGPADQVSRAAGSMTFGSGEGLFVTLFHCRLEVATGRLRYVDAGHGYCVIWRAGGEIDLLPERSLPVGVGFGGVNREGEARLEPGDTLLVYSDGLVEVGDRVVGVRELIAGLGAGEDAARMVRDLLDPVSGRATDDVTVVVLRRLAADQPGAAVQAVGVGRALS